MARYGQPTFAAGEIRPELHSRVDLAKYLTGLALCRNFFVKVFGSLAKRPGLRFVFKTPNIATPFSASTGVRLVPFDFGLEQRYMLYFAPGKMRIVKDNELVLDPATGQIAEIVHGFNDQQIRTLKFVQSADVMFITFQGFVLRQLTRQDHHLWTFTATNFLSTVLVVPGLTATPSGALGAGSLDFEYVVTAEKDNPLEEGEPGSPVIVSDREGLSAAAGKTIALSWNAVEGAKRYNVYRKRSGIFGFVATTSETTYTDDGLSTPDISDTPPDFRRPFEDGIASAVGFFERRLCVSGSGERIESFEMSRIGAFTNFSTSQPLRDDDAIAATLVDDRVQAIRHFVSLARQLMILTSESEWVLNRGANGLTPALEGGVAVESNYGSNDVRPIKIGRDVLWIRAGGDAIMDGRFEFEAAGFDPVEISLLSSHLFEGRSVVDMAYCELPHKLVWLVMSDGGLLSLSYLREQEVFAFAQHSVSGAVMAVGSVREGFRDICYAVVRRTIGGVDQLYVESLDTVETIDPRDAFFVDSGLSLDNPVTVSTLTAGAGGRIEYIAGINDFNPLDLVDIQISTDLPRRGEAPEQRRFQIGTKIIGGLVTRYLLSTEFADENGVHQPVTAADFGSVIPPPSEAVIKVRKAVTQISGLDHLEGQTVDILADGGELAHQVVTGGAITLDQPASRVHVGLNFKADMQTLSLPGGAEIQGRRKNVVEAMIRVRRTRGLAIGPDLDHLNEVKDRAFEVLRETSQLKSQLLELRLQPHWQIDGSFAVRHDHPLPCEILSIHPIFHVGG